MLQFFRSSVLWQFVGGFVIGTLGLVAMQPADANRALADHLHIGHHHVG